MALYKIIFSTKYGELIYETVVHGSSEKDAFLKAVEMAEESGKYIPEEILDTNNLLIK